MRTDILHEIERLKIMEIKPNFSELAKRLNCDRRTASDYYHGKTTSIRKTTTKESKLHGFESIIEDKVDTCSATAMSIFKFIKSKGYSGAYGLVKNYVRNYKNNEIKKATMRFETLPGIQGQVDWKERKKMVSRQGDIFEINIFCYILGYSRMKYFELTFDRKQPTLFKCLSNAFKYTGGIPKQVLFDNMRTVVDQSRTHLTSVVFNQKFTYFAKDFNFEPLACMPYRPQTKGKVEALAKLTNRLDVYNYEFNNEKELIDIVKKINKELNNEVSQATNEIPLLRLEREKEHLIPLPNNQVIESYTSRQKSYSVSPESMIIYKGNKYSVPTHYIGKKLKIKVQNDFLQIFFDSEVIATHYTSENQLNYQKQHLIEILQSDAMKYKGYDEIDDFVETNLRQLDMIIT